MAQLPIEPANHLTDFGQPKFTDEFKCGIKDPDLEEDSFIVVAGAFDIVEVIIQGKGAARFSHVDIGVDGPLLLELLGIGLEWLDLGLVANQALLRIVLYQVFDGRDGGLVRGQEVVLGPGPRGGAMALVHLVDEMFRVACDGFLQPLNREVLKAAIGEEPVG